LYEHFLQAMQGFFATMSNVNAYTRKQIYGAKNGE